MAIVSLSSAAHAKEHREQTGVAPTDFLTPLSELTGAMAGPTPPLWLKIRFRLLEVSGFVVSGVSVLFVGSPLECLTAEEKVEVRETSRLVVLKKQDTLEQGLLQHWLLVVSGIVRVEATSCGGNGCGGFLKKGELICFGTTGLGSSAEVFGIRAVLDAYVYALDPAVLLRIAQRNAHLATVLLKDSMARVRRLYANLAHATTAGATPEMSVGRALRDLSEQASDGRAVVDKRISQREIAESLGWTREQVNRALRRMEEGGQVKKGACGYTLDTNESPEDGKQPVSVGEYLALSKAWNASRERERAELASR